MAHLVRPWTYRYLDKSGRRVPKGTPGAKRVKERARKWYGKGIPGMPKGKKIPLASDKAAALQMLSKLVRAAERGEAGLVDSTTEARLVPLSRHLEDFADGMRNSTRAPSEKQVKQVVQRVRDTFEGCGFVYPPDINGDKVEAYLAGRRRLPRAEGGDLRPDEQLLPRRRGAVLPVDVPNQAEADE